MSNHPQRNWKTQGINDHRYAHENTNHYVPTRVPHNQILAQTTPSHSQGLNDHHYSHENTDPYENSVPTRAPHNQILYRYAHENTNHYENSVRTPAPHNQILAQTAPSHLPQEQSHITQEYSSHQLEPQAPQVSPPATGVWPIRHTYNESPHRENAYNYPGRNSGSRNTLPTPNFTINPSNPRDLGGNSIDSHNQSVNLDDQSVDYGGPSAALPGQSRDIDSQTPSSPADMNQLTHGHAPQTEIFQSGNLRPEGSLYGHQPGFSPYPTPYSNESQDWGQSESLVGPETSSSAASPGDEKSTSMSRSSSRSKQKNSFPCENEDCTASFTRLADLQRHQLTVHTKEKPFPCSVNNCSRVKDRGFSRRDHLTEHLRSYHAMDIPKRKPGQRAAPNSGMMS